MEGVCSKQGCGEEVLLKCLCPEKLKFCKDHIISHFRAEMKNQCSWIDLCSEQGCAEKAKARYLNSKESKFCPQHLIFYLISDTKIVKNPKKHKKITLLSLSAEDKTFMKTKNLLKDFCSVIANELFTIEKDISENFSRDKNYRKEDKIKIIEKVLKMQKNLPPEMMGFEKIPCDSKDFVEIGFTKFLTEIVSTLQRHFPVNATLCKTLTTYLPQMLETAKSIKNANISLYYIKILLSFTDLPERLLRFNAQYIVLHEQMLEQKIFPLDDFICDRIMNIFSKEYISDAYRDLVPTGKFFNDLLLIAISKTFITNLVDRVHGIIIPNLTILIQDNSILDEETVRKCKKLKLQKYHTQSKIESILREKKLTVIGYRIIVFLHELAHFIQKIECKTFGDVENFVALPQNQTQYQLTLLKIQMVTWLSL